VPGEGTFSPLKGRLPPQHEDPGLQLGDVPAASAGHGQREQIRFQEGDIDPGRIRLDQKGIVSE